MPRYSVQTPEVWNQWYTIEADNEEEAKLLVMNGLGTAHPDGPVYVDSLDSTVNDWLVLEEVEFPSDAE